MLFFKQQQLKVPHLPFRDKFPGGGVLPYMGYIGMCGLKGYGFSAALVINRISILAILVLNRVGKIADFGHK